MNLFFGIKNEILFSEIQIPIFTNRNPKIFKANLYRCFPENNSWTIQKIEKDKIKDQFYILENNDINNNEAYFFANDYDFKDYDYLKLKDFNHLTNTVPAYRCNLKIKLREGGFSSYQSEYPFNMTTKSGMIISSVSSIANKDADKNYIFFRNIYYEPIEKEYEGYFINIKSRKIIKKIKIISNYSNFFEISEELINPEVFFVTKNLLGIPMYISLKNKHLSFEHTHPLHEYILSENRFAKIKNFKEKINEIIN